MRSRGLAAALLLALSAAQAEYRVDIGWTQLAAELGDDLPDGSGVGVVQVEGPAEVEGRQTWLPDLEHREFTGKTITDASGAPPGLFSGHATGVGRNFYGNRSSIAPGIEVVASFSAEGWLGNDYLRVAPGGAAQPPRARSERIANHSWVGNAAPLESEILRRMDWVIQRDDFLQLVGLTNGTTNRPLMGNAWNVIAVGRTDGRHGQGSVALDDVYTGGRVRPHLVVPAPNTSQATARASAAAALLVQAAADHPEWSADPVSSEGSSRAGITIPNAGRALVIRAALMAGAQRYTVNATEADIRDYRALPVHRSANGLDTRYGAGQLNVRNSWRILSAGEQNSAEDDPQGQGIVGSEGFDYDPHFGGAGGSNAIASYRLPVCELQSLLAVTLNWNLRIVGSSGILFDSSANLHMLDLELFDVTDPGNPVLLQASTARNDNSQNLWVPLAPGREHLIRVSRPDGEPPFDWPFAIAWRIAPDPDGDGVPDSPGFSRCSAGRPGPPG
ncbi:MAG: hypothetical protein JJT85_05210 [Chromatiales bacterium]|nr:hypothetical protein [Chromatiales bacterium]